ncbi:MAG TPA: response regulator, partial [Methylomirabilota bacterium]
HAAAHLAGRRAAPSVAAAVAERTLVLVVDDLPTNRSLLERQLNVLGYASETAENGARALEKWSSGRFALVITDCHMPEMDGYDFARAIRREAAGRSLARMPVIACTANALRGESDVCFAAGMDDYLPQPIEMAALARALDRWLPLPAAERPADGAAGAPAVEPDPPPIEPGPLADLTAGDQIMERDILREYRTANDADVAALTDALARKDLADVVRVSHRIKGASRMVGASALAAVCASIEQAGRRKDWPAVATEEDRLRREISRLNGYLSAREAGPRE